MKGSYTLSAVLRMRLLIVSWLTLALPMKAYAWRTSVLAPARYGAAMLVPEYATKSSARVFWLPR